MKNLSLFLIVVALTGVGTLAAQSKAEWTRDSRWEALHRARVMEDSELRNIAKRDIFAGPEDKKAPAYLEDIVCEWQPKPTDHKGKSKKFFCKIPGEEKAVKIKIPENNLKHSEVWSEVAATRLFWALGFAADRVYPVVVHCRGCPENPWTAKGPRANRVYEHAILERKYPGKSIELYEDQGFSLKKELDLSDTRYGGSGKAEKDALKLLAALVFHIDGDDGNQRLSCDEGAEFHEGAQKRCRKPTMLIHDLGATFGSILFRGLSYSSMDLQKWAETPVWKDPKRCVARLNSFIVSSFKHPKISEEGRALLADRLKRLSLAQRVDIFRVAGVMAKGDSPMAWAEALSHKIEQITEHRCP